jgi:hypothetical protein
MHEGDKKLVPGFRHVWQRLAILSVDFTPMETICNRCDHRDDAS